MAYSNNKGPKSTKSMSRVIASPTNTAALGRRRTGRRTASARPMTSKRSSSKTYAS